VIKVSRQEPRGAIPYRYSLFFIYSKQGRTLAMSTKQSFEGQRIAPEVKENEYGIDERYAVSNGT
jgi:hypothetical protein